MITETAPAPYDTIMAMTRLEELLLFMLDRAHKKGMGSLSRFQMFKIPYMLQVFSIKYAGTPFVPGATFMRDENGPISRDIYEAVRNLERKGNIKTEIEKGHEGYPYDRCSHRLGKKLPKLSFTVAEQIFLDGFLAELLPLTQKKLKELAYSTEPMRQIQAKEKNGKILKGSAVDFSAVTVDPDVVDAYSDSDIS